MSEFLNNKWVEGDTSAVDTWRDRVQRFRENHDFIQLRVFRYERIPDPLNSDARQTVLRMIDDLEAQLASKERLTRTKNVAYRFITGGLSTAALDEEFTKLGEIAATHLKAAAGQ